MSAPDPIYISVAPEGGRQDATFLWFIDSLRKYDDEIQQDLDYFSAKKQDCLDLIQELKERESDSDTDATITAQACQDAVSELSEFITAHYDQLQGYQRLFKRYAMQWFKPSIVQMRQEYDGWMEAGHGPGGSDEANDEAYERSFEEREGGNPRWALLSCLYAGMCRLHALHEEEIDFDLDPRAYLEDWMEECAGVGSDAESTGDDGLDGGDDSGMAGKSEADVAGLYHSFRELDVADEGEGSV